MTSAQLRAQFIDFFVRKHGHRFVPSSPVVPQDDPTLLFTNAGMNQFKPIFLGDEKRDYSRAVNSQKCIRAGGKHNDLDDVGRSRRHHTFFEMLGNWSFGDYFKREAIQWAWELLTVEWKLDPSRLHVTCFEGDEASGVPRDVEAAQLWKEIADLPDDHIHFFGKDNFWEMGETGPCGPCTEIHVDSTPDRSGGRSVNGSDPRVMEIWNLVFIQYNRNPDRSLTPLKNKHVDTGMGFERLCRIIQGKTDNYATDIWQPLFAAISEITRSKYGGLFPKSDTERDPSESQDKDLMRDIAFRVIADHARMATFAITDGATPGNKGRDSVVRSVIRRAVRFGYQQFGLREPFLHRMGSVIADTMGEAFPELRAESSRVCRIIETEESQFLTTIERGIEMFEAALSRASRTGGRLGGKDAFDLHTTYGFPVDMTVQLAMDRGISVDKAEYERLFEDFQRQSGASRASHADLALDLSMFPPTDDSPKYTGTELRAKIVGYVSQGAAHQSGNIPADTEVALLLDRTCFYAEAGGQVGDSGTITTPGGRFEVTSTDRRGECVLHYGKLVSGQVSVGESASLQVSPKRNPIMRNHTGTHLLNWALRRVLGDHVEQKGSLVDDEKLRFDFSHDRPLTNAEVETIETLVNERISARLPVSATVMPLEAARSLPGVRAVFGERYPDPVRVVAVGTTDPRRDASPDMSLEFCGGTHVQNSADIEAMVVTSEESVSRGVRRLVAVTGTVAKQSTERGAELCTALKEAESVDPAQLAEQINGLQQSSGGDDVPLVVKRQAQVAIAALQAKFKAWQKQQSQQSAAAFDVEAKALELLSQARGDVVVGRIDGATDDQLRSLMDSLRKRKPTLALMLASVANEKVMFLSAVSDDLVARGLKAGDWVRETAKVAGGGGGGRPQMAQAGGKDVSKVDDALSVARAFAEKHLG